MHHAWPGREAPPGRAPAIEASVAELLTLRGRRGRRRRVAVGQARDDLQRLIGAVVRHRQKGADLVWEAYNVDIGGTE